MLTLLNFLFFSMQTAREKELGICLGQSPGESLDCG